METQSKEDLYKQMLISKIRMRSHAAVSVVQEPQVKKKQDDFHEFQSDDEIDM